MVIGRKERRPLLAFVGNGRIGDVPFAVVVRSIVESMEKGIENLSLTQPRVNRIVALQVLHRARYF